MRLLRYGPADLGLAVALETDPVVMAELGGPVPVERIREVHQERLSGMADGDWYHTVVPDGTSDPVGLVGIWRTPWDGATIHEFGIMLLPGYHGRRVGMAACAELLGLARESGRFERLHSFASVGNAASNAGCRALGFTRLGQCDVDYAGRPLRCNHWLLDLTA